MKCKKIEWSGSMRDGACMLRCTRASRERLRGKLVRVPNFW